MPSIIIIVLYYSKRFFITPNNEKKKDGIDNRDIPISHAEYMNKKQITSFTKQRTLIIEVLTITMNRNVLETILISFLQVHLPRIIIFFFFFLSIARIPKKKLKARKKNFMQLGHYFNIRTLAGKKKRDRTNTILCVPLEFANLYLWRLRP